MSVQCVSKPMTVSQVHETQGFGQELGLASSAVAKKSVKDSQVEMLHLVCSKDVSPQKIMFGGDMIYIASHAARLAFVKFFGSDNVMLKKTDFIRFQAAVKEGDVLKVVASVNRVWEDCAEVGVKLLIDSSFDPARRPAPPVRVLSTYLTFSALDANGKVMRLAQPLLETADERRRFENAHVRKNNLTHHYQRIIVEKVDGDFPSSKLAKGSLLEHSWTALMGDLSPSMKVIEEHIIKLAAVVAPIVAFKYTKAKKILALGIDPIHILEGVKENDFIKISAFVTRLWKTSMEVKVVVSKTSSKGSNIIFSTYFVFNVLGENNLPMELPQIKPETENERRYFEQADARKKMRLGQEFLLSRL